MPGTTVRRVSRTGCFCFLDFDDFLVAVGFAVVVGGVVAVDVDGPAVAPSGASTSAAWFFGLAMVNVGFCFPEGGGRERVVVG